MTDRRCSHGKMPHEPCHLCGLPTQEAYDAACKALWHWRAEAERLGKIVGVKPREMKRGATVVKINR